MQNDMQNETPTNNQEQREDPPADQRDERNRLLSARYRLHSERRQIALDLDELDTESMPGIATDYREHLDRLTRQIQRLDARITEFTRQMRQTAEQTTEKEQH